MTLEAGKEMDRRCVINWLNEVYVMPSGAFDEYTEDELKMFAYDTLVLLNLLKEQDRQIIELKEKLRHMEYGNQDAEQSLLMPAT